MLPFPTREAGDRTGVLPPVSHFPFGQAVIVREVLKGRPWTTRVLRVVRDDAGLVALYLMAGSPMMCPVGGEGAFDRTALRHGYHFEMRRWQRTHALVLARPGEPWSTRVMWDAATGGHLGYYVNIEEPMRRTALGFDTMDDELDIVVQPDRSWAWKDEDVFARWVGSGLYDPADVQRIRAAAVRAEAMVTSWGAPLCDGWESWRPPAQWRVPGMPAGWQDVPATHPAVGGPGGDPGRH